MSKLTIDILLEKSNIKNCNFKTKKMYDDFGGLIGNIIKHDPEHRGPQVITIEITNPAVAAVVRKKMKMSKA